MRLRRLALLEDFKSLSAFDKDFRGPLTSVDAVAPVCFAGLNGSGKSNVIELLAEIFCYLELLHLDYEKLSDNARKTDLRFVIEFDLAPSDSLTRQVRIRKDSTRPPSFFEINDEGEEKELISKTEQVKVLPNRILGYSSGLNETISAVFGRNQYWYSKEVGEAAISNSKQRVAHTRTLYMDYDSNAPIVVANYLFATEEEKRLFQDHVRITDVHSFRIVVHLKRPNKTAIETTPEINNNIERLKACATVTWHDEGQNLWTFDYFVNEATRAAFLHQFKSASQLFVALYKLWLLNSLALDGESRKFYTRPTVQKGLIERPPTVPLKDKILALTKLRLRIQKPTRVIDYAAISDGEHQFLHVFGTILMFAEPNTLFLLDEPETHLNPKWRVDFVRTLNQIAEERNQEFVVSTHSPFLISDCRQANTYHFTRHDNEIRINQVRFETFGSSFDYLLSELFDIPAMISNQAIEELKTIIQRGDLKEMLAAVPRFGESLEKRFLFEKIETVLEDKN
ncbi:hypothetical protein Mal35_54890 [Gimesia maris]|uniref:restriction system-associated AAA family ATPase n=1 Tax=Gimesia maris TaxID=122 RepID=UPI00118A5C81|nr:restriction system-associated AAA family ATPase [Gimesia maris]QDT81998.1 hypothetical protein Mal35_54890 [Gimesia maris]